MSGSLNEIMAAIAGQVKALLEPNLPGVQVEPAMVSNPTPPSIDIYPADPFLEQTAFGVASREATFIVRARVTAADEVAGQQLLLDLLDPRGDLSMLAALASDSTFGGVVDDSTVDGGPSGFLSYAANGGGGDLVGAEWRTRVVL